MNNLERLADIFGSKKEIAHIFCVDPSYVTRLCKHPNQRVPIRFNQKIRAAMRDKARAMGPTQAVAFVEAVESCLDPAVCPTCHQPLPEDQIV